MGDQLNDDFTRFAVMHTDRMDWQQSPSPSVWRKRLELSGPAEAGRVTSIVRYEPESEFPPHPHPDGEEILVLDGVFSDESGDYSAGSFLLNPEGFKHAPRSREGCILFVKLRQYPGAARERVIVDTHALGWQQGTVDGISFKLLYQEDGYPEVIRLVRYVPGTRFPGHDHPGGEEILVIDGTLEDENGRYVKGSWFRYPVGSRHAPFSEDGCTLYVKTGHLSGL